MGVNIHVKPSETWEFFEKNKKRLETVMVCLAENEETNHAVYLTEDKGFPMFLAYKGEEKLCSEGAVSAADSEDTAKRIYLKYLFPVVVDLGRQIGSKTDSKQEESYDPELEKQDMEDMIYEREDELQLAAMDFLCTLLCCKSHEELTASYNDIIEAFMDWTCQYFADEHLISVWRPMFITDDETGSEILIEYPYLEVDDPAEFG